MDKALSQIEHLRKIFSGMGWIRVSQNRHKSRALVNTVMNIKMLGISWLVEELSYQKRLCSMELVS